MQPAVATVQAGASTGSQHALRFVGGAVVGFELSPRDLRAVEHRFGFAAAGPTPQPPAITYRRGTGRNGRAVFERHDPLRDRPVERIGSRLDDVIDDLHLSIALHASDDVFVHAGVVAWNGKAILLPGRSHAGKSTLVDALVRAGAVYYSDEYARITSEGAVAPYARPIHLRAEAGRHLVDPQSIGEVACPPGLVVFTQYVRSASFDPQPVSPAQAALELFDNVVIAQLDPARAVAAVAQVARDVGAISGPRPDAPDVVPAILALADKMVVAP